MTASRCPEHTTNSGATYTATFTVSAGQTNQSYPLQISGVTITGQYGGTSAPIAGSDVQKTINASNTTVSNTGTGPTLYQVTPVPSVTTSATPSYGFVSTEAGTIHYGGDCSSATASAIAGLNTVTFSALANGAHTDCTIAITDANGYTSAPLAVGSFTVQTTAGTTTVTTSTPVPGYQFEDFMGYGSQGADVTALQEQLTTDGVYSGPITGYFGSLTEAAVAKFQGLHGIEQAGYVGPNTRAALNAGE